MLGAHLEQAAHQEEEVRQREEDRADDQDRADREWLPRALAGGLKQFAVVLPESGLAGMNLMDRLKEVPNAKLQVGYFATVEQAREWLAR